MFLACGIWCLAEVSSVSPSSEHTDTILILISCVGISQLALLNVPVSFCSRVLYLSVCVCTFCSRTKITIMHSGTVKLNTVTMFLTYKKGRVLIGNPVILNCYRYLLVM